MHDIDRMKLYPMLVSEPDDLSIIQAWIKRLTSYRANISTAGPDTLLTIGKTCNVPARVDFIEADGNGPRRIIMRINIYGLEAFEASPGYVLFNFDRSTGRLVAEQGIYMAYDSYFELVGFALEPNEALADKL